jgi:imidazolonepropionase-like amidohydrolase
VHHELELLVRAGLTPMQALEAGTRRAAEMVRADDAFGTIEVGKRADLLILDANPLEDIRNTQKIAAVVLNGRYLDRQALGDLLAAAERAANPADDRRLAR